MLSKKTIKRIIKNTNLFGVYTVIGKYTYTFDNNNGYIYRCKTDDNTKRWIDTDGNIITPWEFVQKI